MDVIAIEAALNNFINNAHPSNTNADASTPATVGDINKLIEATVVLVNEIINEIE